MNLELATRANPGTPEAAGLREWLAQLDEAAWIQLAPILQSIASEVPPAADQCPEDVFCELAALSFERWIPTYRDALERGETTSPLRSYLKLRLRRHVFEARRKEERRRELASAQLIPSTEEKPRAVLMEPIADPFEASVVSEIARKATKDPTLLQILALRFAGFSQKEIARQPAVQVPSHSTCTRPGSSSSTSSTE